MKTLKTFEGFFKDAFLPYVPFDDWDEIDKHRGETMKGTVVSKRIKNTFIGGDKYLLGIEFDEGFTEEVPVNFDTYSRSRVGGRINIEL